MSRGLGISDSRSLGTDTADLQRDTYSLSDRQARALSHATFSRA